MSALHFQIPDPTLVCLSDIEPKVVEWLWEPFLPIGMVSLLSGDPGSGKTFLSLAISAALSNGQMPFTQNPCEPVNTLYLSRENSPEYVTRPRYDSLKGNCHRFHILSDAITLADIGMLEQAINRAQAKLVIVDPIQSYLGADVDLHRSNETRPILDGLVEVADNFGCSILLVRHLSKSSGGRAIHRGLGSIDITGAARTELLAGCAPEDPSRRAVVVMKSNIGPINASLGYSIGDDGFIWTGESDLTANDLLASDHDGETRSKVEGAAEFIKAELASGPKLQKELVAHGRYSERTLQRAAESLKVQRNRLGERGEVFWSLA